MFITYIKAVIAGMLISFGCIANCVIENKIAGAIMFSMGLFGILVSELNLFTGKAGLLATKEIKIVDLFLILIGNGCGVGVVGLFVPEFANGSLILEKSAAIMDIRIMNPWYINIFLGACCGILMYLAVLSYKKGNYLMVPFFIGGFILCGFNHCIADMFYLFNAKSWQGVFTVCLTVIGNLIGCNIIPTAAAHRKVLQE